MRLTFRTLFTIAAILTAVPVSRAGQSTASLIDAGIPSNCAAYAASVSSSEGGWSSVGRTNTKYGVVNCYGAFQFCSDPGQAGGGTFGDYVTGMTPDQFLASPSAQVAAWMQYEQKVWGQAQSNGLTAAIGQTVCYGGTCAVITESSILKACQFGCASGGKLSNFVNGGFSCSAPGVSDGNGTNVCSYLVSGAGLDASCFTGNNPPVGEGTCLVETQSKPGVRVYSGYGMRGKGGWHQGLDIVNSAGRGDPIKAGISGTALSRASTGHGGNSVQVLSDDKSEATISYHLDSFADGLDPGRSNLGSKHVKAGDVIGYMGDTGVTSVAGGGVHHHLGLVLNGSAAKRGIVNGPIVGASNAGSGFVTFGTKKGGIEVAQSLMRAGTYYFVNPETFLPYRIPYRPGSTVPEDDHPDGLTLAPTCSTTAIGDGNSAPQSTGSGTSAEAGVSSQGASRIASTDFEKTSAGGDKRSIPLNRSRIALDELSLSATERDLSAAGDMGLALSILQAIDDQ